MDEDHEKPSEVNSADVNKVLHSSTIYWNKKRKFQAEHLGLPMPKHKRSFSSECDYTMNENPEAEDFNMCINKDETDGGLMGDESVSQSAKGGNSIGGDTGSSISVSGEAKTESKYAMRCSHDLPSTSSGKWGSGISRYMLYSLESRLVAKSSDREGPSCIGSEHGFSHLEFENHPYLDLDGHLLEFENNIGYDGSEHGSDSIDQFTNDEPEDMLCADEMNQNKYVLASGRWNVNQDTQSGTRKLTIDKEFEQYFSMLML